ncbi:MAG: thermonuclease family protein [Pseudanabaenaceae cyanobacterium]
MRVSELDPALKFGVALILLIIANLALIWFTRLQPQGEPWQVVEVISGELVKMNQGNRTETVRLIGVRAPSPDQAPFGGEARARLEQLLPKGATALVQTDLQQRSDDDQLLAYVWSGEQMVNQVLIAEGYTLANVTPPNVQYKELLNNAQSRARLLELGIWNPERPLRRLPRGERRSR